MGCGASSAAYEARLATLEERIRALEGASAKGTEEGNVVEEEPAKPPIVAQEWGSVADRFDMILRHPSTDFCVHLRDGSNGWIYIMKGNLTRKVESSGSLRQDTLSGGQEGKKKLVDNPTQTVLQLGEDYQHGKWTVRSISQSIEIHHEDLGHMYTLTAKAVVAGQPTFEPGVSNMMSIMSSSLPGTGILNAWASSATSCDLTMMHKATKFHIHLRDGSNGWVYVMKGQSCAKVEPHWSAADGPPCPSSPFSGGKDQKDLLEAQPDQNMLPEDGSKYKHGTWTLLVVKNTITLTHEQRGEMYILTETTVKPATEQSNNSVRGMVTFWNS